MDTVLVPATCPHCGASITVKVPAAVVNAAATAGKGRATPANPAGVSPRRSSRRA